MSNSCFESSNLYDPALHLFVDDEAVRNVFAMKRIFGEPEKIPEPGLEDIEGRSVTWASAMREPDGLYRLWYQSYVKASSHDVASAGVWGKGADYGYYPDRHSGATREWQVSVVSYAESNDGFHWRKPELGLFDWRGSKRNNIVLDGSAAARATDGRLTNMDSVSVLRDDAAPANERYKLICHWETVHCWDNEVSALDRSAEDMRAFWSHRAKYLSTSADGIHWSQSLARIKGCAGGGDYCGVTRDERNGLWWFNDRASVGPSEARWWRRTAGLCVSDSLYKWPETVEQVFPLGEYEDFGARYEHHGMTPFNYGDMDLGYLELSIKGRPVANLLVSHRDGQPWRLVNGHEAFLAVGPAGAPDEWVVNATRNPPLVAGDKLVIPYNGRSHDKRTGERTGLLLLATLRLDGFAGFTVDKTATARHDKPAMVQTRAVEVRTDELYVNIEGHQGSARVMLLDENGSAIDGFGLRDCLPIDEDNVRAPVRWKSPRSPRELKGRRVIVMMQLDSGTVWSVRL